LNLNEAINVDDPVLVITALIVPAEPSGPEAPTVVNASLKLIKRKKCETTIPRIKKAASFKLPPYRKSKGRNIG